MATMQKKSGASKGKGKSATVLKDLDAKRVASGVKGGHQAGLKSKSDEYLKVKLVDVRVT